MRFPWEVKRPVGKEKGQPLSLKTLILIAVPGEPLKPVYTAQEGKWALEQGEIKRALWWCLGNQLVLS